MRDQSPFDEIVVAFVARLLMNRVTVDPEVVVPVNTRLLAEVI